VRRALGALAALALLLLVVTPTGRYLLRAAWEEGKILRRRRLIAEVIANPATDPRTRGKLALVLAARAFAADSVRLRAGESFTTFSPLSHDTLVLVLSGAYRDRLERYSWWFPIVGRVPYKGFFDFGAAKEAARELERRGYDSYLRPSPAFSTLGWFNDPVLSTSLREDSLDLANTVIHELTHNTFYAPGQAVFNESFANFVGARGAAWFFRARGDGAAAAKVDARWADERLIGAFYTGVYRALDSAFKARPGDDAAARGDRIRARDTVFARARRFLADSVAPGLHGPLPKRWAERVRLDNAVVLARRIYLTDLQVFDAAYDREGRDLPRTIARVVALAQSRPRDPYGALKDWLGAR
jgi:predicted aminopeptidase